VNCCCEGKAQEVDSLVEGADCERFERALANPSEEEAIGERGRVGHRRISTGGQRIHRTPVPSV
jgi:hypothetical protein